MDNIYQKFESKALENDTTVEKYIIQQINQNIILKTESLQLLKQIKQENPTILINILEKLELDIFKQLFFRVDDLEILEYIFENNTKLMIRLSKIKGPSQQLSSYLFDSDVEKNKMYFFDTCKYSNLMRQLSKLELYELTYNLFKKETTSRGKVIKHFQQLLIAHQDMAYSDETTNRNLIYKSTALLSKLAKNNSTPKKLTNYKKLTNSKNENLHNLAFQSFRLSCIAPCRSIYQLRQSTLRMNNNFINFTIQSMENILLSNIFHGDLIELSKKMMYIILDSEKMEFDAIDDLLAFYREVFTKKPEYIHTSGDLLLKVIIRCLKNTENADFWINCCFLAKTIIDKTNIFNNDLTI